MKYTKKQRHEIYKKALQIFKDGKASCLCWALAYGGVEYDYLETRIVITEFMKTHLPEFELFDPQDESPYWFTCSEHRETVLEFCIEMTK